MRKYLASNDWLNPFIPSIMGAVGASFLLAGALTWTALKYMNKARQRKKELRGVKAQYAKAHAKHQTIRAGSFTFIKHDLLSDPKAMPICEGCSTDEKPVHLFLQPKRRFKTLEESRLIRMGIGPPPPPNVLYCPKCKTPHPFDGDTIDPLREEAKELIG